MLKTTTSTVDGKPIEAYLDIVVGEAILGANFIKDWLSSITDMIGGRSGSYESEMIKARKVAFEEMEAQARDLNADGIVGIDIDYEVVGEKGGMMMVSVSGTAVRFKKT